MHATLVKALVGSENEAADELLLEGLKIGTAAEQSVVLDALLVRKTTRGLAGVVQNYDALPPTLQTHVLDNIRMLYSALRECGRSDNSDARLASMKLIALSRQGKLAYVLSENLHDPDEVLSKAAVEALVALSRWVATSTRRLQRDYADQVLKPLAQENAATPADSEKPPATTAPVNAIATAKPTPGTSSGSTLSPATANARATAAAAAAASGARSASETESPSATNAAPTGASPASHLHHRQHCRKRWLIFPRSIARSSISAPKSKPLSPARWISIAASIRRIFSAPPCCCATGRKAKRWRSCKRPSTAGKARWSAGSSNHRPASMSRRFCSEPRTGSCACISASSFRTLPKRRCSMPCCAKRIG
jgi:hypothetical protein